MDNGQWWIRRERRDMIGFSVRLAILSPKSRIGLARFLDGFESLPNSTTDFMHPAQNSPDLAPYKKLHGADVVQHPELGSCFVCEGRYLVEEAIRAARSNQLHFISALCDPRQSDEWKDKIPPSAPLLTLDADELNSFVGFNFHRGVLCCCAVPEPPDGAVVAKSARLLVLPHLDSADNLGQLVRTAAALGMDAILLGRGPSPFSRRCVRVSMGGCWKIPILKTDDPCQLLEEWLSSVPGATSEIVGTASIPNAESALQWVPKQRTALVLGSESHGLEPFWRSNCTKHVRIPLAREMDSLNVSAAGAILMGIMVA
jgi:tRNA G18 (ribose-2'-O)-methylase SpoU